MYHRFFVFALIVFAFPLIALPCDLCGCFVPNETVYRGFQFGVTEQFSSLSNLSLEGEVIQNEEDQYLNSSNTVLFGNYHFNERLALQVNAPLIYRSFQRMEGETLERGTESGLGDLLLITYYVPFQRKTPSSQFNWKVLAGLKFPTGNSDPIEEDMNMDMDPMSDSEMMEPSAVHGADIALGSGSWDGLIGTNVYGRMEKWFYSGQIQYTIRSRGAFDYRYANDLLWYARAGYYVSSSRSWPVALNAFLTGEHKGEDEMGNEKTADMAMTTVFVGPSALIGVKQLGVAEVGIGFPLSVNNSGLQATPKYRLRVGMSWQLR
jgi:hypothetical protein